MTIEQRFPYRVQTNHPYSVVVPWCESTIGQFDNEWYRLGSDIAAGLLPRHLNQDTYLFANQEHAALFALKWK